jgi:aminomethyltransferase
LLDDILIYRRPEGAGFMVVVNASNRYRDVEWMHRQRQARSGFDVTVEDISDATGMIAIQGPRAVEIAQSLSPDDLSGIEYYHWRSGTIAGVPAMIARTGYTGEDGFEIYPAIEDAGRVWDALLEAGSDKGLVPVGLGARDTLRLEARMPLYGQELSDTISPFEAGIGWAVKLDKGEFIGREAMARVKAQGPKRKAVGFRMTERSGTPRTHYPAGIDQTAIGEVTSGAYSPTLGENIGLALVPSEHAGIGKPLQVQIRGKWVNAEQVKTPFYKRSRS